MPEMSEFPTVDQLSDYLPPECVQGVNLALARWQRDQLAARVAELEAAQAPPALEAAS